MKRKQSGVSLSGLLGAAVVLAMLALLGMKVGPEFMEYFQIVKAVKKITHEPGEKNSVAEVRKAFERHATVDNIRAISADDLEISKDGGALVITFAYERRVPLFANVSLLFDFQGSNQE
jgi:hypothetical protein